MKLIENLKHHFNEVRGSEDHVVIKEWFEKAKEIQSEFRLEPIASDNMATQQRPVRFGIEDLNEEDIQNFKTNFVYPILEIALLKLQERFEYLTEVKNIYGFLFDLHSPSISLDQCQRLENELTSAQDNSKDVYATNLFDEIKSFQVLIDDDGKKSPLAFLNKIQEFGLVPIYPNLTTALKIFLTLPVTVAAAESSFSKLKIIKNYLRTTMGQERLTNLAMISIESELLNCISQESVMQNFAEAKARQVIFT